MAVKKGDKVKIEYEGKLEDGTVFDSSAKHGKPLEFEIGSGQVIPGFENAVEGMEKGQEKEFKLQPSEAYGSHNPDLVKKVPREQLPKEQEPKAGMILAVKMPNGLELPAKITNVNSNEVTIDLNPPLVGKVLNFNVKVVDVQ